MAKVLAAVLFLFFLIPPSSGSSAPAKIAQELQPALDELRNENIEEAIEALRKIVKKNPQSPEAVYRLGLAYKEALDYSEAERSLRDALRLDPSLAEARYHLGEIMYEAGRFSDAVQELSKALVAGVRPAQTEYLIGLCNVERDKLADAVASFSRAAEMDKSLEQPAAYWAGIAYFRNGLLADAEKSFGRAVEIDHGSDLAASARTYVERIRPAAAVPYGISAGYRIEYDDNVVLKPSDESAAAAISGERDWRHVFQVDGHYDFGWPRPGKTRLAYGFYQSLHREQTDYDVQSHTLTVSPETRRGARVIRFPLAYGYTSVGRDGYLSAVSFQPAAIIPVTRHSAGQVSGRVQYKDFLKAPSSEDENRDGFNALASAAFFQFFREDRAFVNVQYAFDYDRTDGKNWESWGNKLAVQLFYPVSSKARLQLFGEYYRQDYRNTHSVYGLKRRDSSFSVSPQIVYETGPFALDAQYTHTTNDSNLDVYEYSRGIYSAGVRYRW